MTARLDPVRKCFSTLGCADLGFPEICALARRHQITGLELRGIGGDMDMPKYCAAQGLDSRRIAELCTPVNAGVIVAGSSLKLTSVTEAEKPEFLTFCGWAESIGARYVRVFGGGTWGKALTEAEYEHAVAFLGWWHAEQRARGWKVDVLLETHDAFSGSEPCLNLNRRLAQPVYLIWDSHHTWRLGREAPEATWKQIGHLVRHVHLKDSVDQASARHPFTYVLPGDGQMPVATVMNLLQEVGYKGFVSLEWERHWHPYLPPITKALARLDERNWFIT